MAGERRLTLAALRDRQVESEGEGVAMKLSLAANRNIHRGHVLVADSLNLHTLATLTPTGTYLAPPPGPSKRHAYAMIGEEALFSSIDGQKSWHGVKSASLARYHYRRQRQRWRNKSKRPCSVDTPGSEDVDVDGRLQQKCSSRGGVVGMLAMYM